MYRIKDPAENGGVFDWEAKLRLSGHMRGKNF